MARRGRSARTSRARCSPSHPADSSYARGRGRCCAARDFAVDAHVGGRARCRRAGRRRVLVIAHPSEPRWERVVPGGSPLLAAEELDAIEAFVRDGGGLVAARREEQEKYGTNLVELAERFGIAVDNARRLRLRAPPPDAQLGPRRPRRPRGTGGRWRRPARARRAGLLLPRGDADPGRRRARARAHRADRVGARRGAARGHRARRRPRRRGRGLRPVRRRLHRRARPRRTCGATSCTGPRSRAFARARARAAVRRRGRPALAGAQGAHRRPAPAPGARRRARPRARRATPPRATSTRWPRRSRASRRASPTTPPTSTAVVADLRAWAAGGFARPDFAAALERVPARPAPRRTASSTSSSSRCTCRTRARATRASRR